MRLILSFAVSAVLGMQAAAAFAGAENDIKYRQSVMKTSGGHMMALGAILKGDVPHKQDIPLHLDGLVAVATMLPHLFPAGSDKGTAKTKTKAKAEIWSNAAAFDVKVKDFQKATTALQVAAKGADPAAVGAAMGGVGKACKGCHDKFEAKE